VTSAVVTAGLSIWDVKRRVNLNSMLEKGRVTQKIVRESDVADSERAKAARKKFLSEGTLETGMI